MGRASFLRPPMLVLEMTSGVTRQADRLGTPQYNSTDNFGARDAQADVKLRALPIFGWIFDPRLSAGHGDPLDRPQERAARRTHDVPESLPLKRGGCCKRARAAPRPCISKSRQPWTPSALRLPAASMQQRPRRRQREARSSCIHAACATRLSSASMHLEHPAVGNARRDEVRPTAPAHKEPGRGPLAAPQAMGSLPKLFAAAWA